MSKKTALLFFIITIIFTSPILFNPHYWPAKGHDADELISRMALERKALLDYHQFPFWTPAIGGGQNLFLPISMTLSPFFILILALGEILGIKILIVLYLFFGLCGMYLLSQHLGCEKTAAYLPPVVFLLSSIYPLQVAEGAYGNLSIVWVPWLFLYFLRSFQSPKCLFPALLFSLLILYGGGIAPVFSLTMVFLTGYSILESLRSKSIIPLRNLAYLAVLAALAGAILFLPLLDLSGKHYPFSASRPDYGSAFVTFQALFSRSQLLNVPRNKLWNLPLDVSFWEQRGGYVGVACFVLYLIGMVAGDKKQSSLKQISVVFLLLSTVAFPRDWFRYMKNEFFFEPLHNFSRFIWFFVLTLSVIAGLGLSRIEAGLVGARSKKTKIFIGAVVSVIFLELIFVSRPIFREAFTRPPQDVKRAKSFVQVWHDNVYEESKIYPTILGNQGLSVDNFTMFQDVCFCNAVSFGAGKYRGEIYLQNGGGNKFSVDYLSPNVIKIKPSFRQDDVLVINQNYDPDWRVEGLSHNKISSQGGLIAAAVGPQDKGIITFYYFPRSVFWGGIISALTLLATTFYFLRWMPRKAFFFVLVLLMIGYAGFVLRFKWFSDHERKVDLANKNAFRGYVYAEENNLSEATYFLEQASSYYSNSIVLHQTLKEIYRLQGFQKGLSREVEMLNGLLPVSAEPSKESKGIGL